MRQHLCGDVGTFYRNKELTLGLDFGAVGREIEILAKEILHALFVIILV